MDPGVVVCLAWYCKLATTQTAKNATQQAAHIIIFWGSVELHVSAAFMLCMICMVIGSGVMGGMVLA